MRIYRLFLFLAFIPSACAQSNWSQVSAFSFDWDNHANVQFVLSTHANGTPGDFKRVTISVLGHKPIILKNENGWVKFRSEEASTSPEIAKAVNRITSEYVLAQTAAATRTLLFLFGYSYGSSPGSLDVLEISSDGMVRRIFHRDEMGLKEFRDMNGDGVAEIVGYPCLSQEWGNGLLTYDPYDVFTLAETKGLFVSLSLPLSKEYNLNHYYGWAGPNCSEDMAVVLHPPNGGKPIVTTAKEAERLTSGKK